MKIIIENKLADFRLSVQNHIDGITSDGAAVMKKVARLLQIESQLCLAYGIHLAVVDSLVVSKNSENVSLDSQ